MYAYFIEYTSRETTADDVGNAFNRAFGGSFVSRVVGSTTQDYKTYWKSFIVYFKDSCVDDLFGKNTSFHSFMDRYVLYYNDTDYWDVHLIKLHPTDPTEIGQQIEHPTEIEHPTKMIEMDRDEFEEFDRDEFEIDRD
jgi:hypothetical protein